MLGGQLTNQKLSISRKFSHRGKSSEPHIRLPSLGLWQGAPREAGFEGQRGLATGISQDWGNKFHSWRALTESSVYQNTGKRIIVLVRD